MFRLMLLFMIVIMSNAYDLSTCKVIDHLLCKGKEFVVLHDSDFMRHVGISMKREKLTIYLDTPKGKINSDAITSFWYRRGRVNRKFFPLQDDTNRTIKEKHLLSEWKYVQEFVSQFLEGLPSIGSYERSTYTRKLQNLLLASQVGFDIPETLVSNDRDCMFSFVDRHEEVITKSIERDLNHSDARQTFGAFGTRVVNRENIEKLNGSGLAYHSLLQECLNKEYELRIFYLKGKMWAMAIFSQMDPQTSVDFRAYNEERPNRMVPYSLKEDTHNKIVAFMGKAGLNTGSLDFVVTKDNRLIFLEVNPVGQYDFVSHNCNYCIDKEIAEQLSL